MSGAPGDDGTRAALAREARWLHGSLLGAAPPASVVDRYVAAVLHCFGPCGTALQPALLRLADRGVDAEAVDMAWRGRPRGETLRARIRILLHLVEARAEHAPLFTPRASGRTVALARLAAAALRTAWKLLKGHVLVRFHGVR